jgi:putative exosortase-associated protein (TIGR04073 family)
MTLSLSALAFAETSNISPANRPSVNKDTPQALQHKAGMKAERGVKNILFGWTDIPRSIAEVTTDSGNPIWGLAAGTFKGIGTAFPRTVSGISDVVMSPVANCDELPVKPGELNTQIR